MTPVISNLALLSNFIAETFSSRLMSLSAIDLVIIILYFSLVGYTLRFGRAAGRVGTP